MALPDLLRTKVHLTALQGVVTRHPGAYELRTPLVPNFFHGNCLVLESAPNDLAATRALFAKCFGAESRHQLFVWGPDQASPTILEEARSAGFETDGSVAMTIDTPPGVTAHRWTIRHLTVRDLDASFALADASDGSGSPDGDPHYIDFKTRMRDLQTNWITSGQIPWWGAFDGSTLVGQCGMAHCDSEVGAGLGRFQAVEVHPDHQRRGIATALISTVARDALERLGCPRVLLEADPTGPAIALYERIGFRRTGDVHALLHSTSSIRTRPELAADHADVRSVTESAFGQPDEAALVRSLRPEPGVISLVAERNGQLLGHVLFSPVTVASDDGEPWTAVALAPLAVRPDSRRQGAGAALVEAGLDACRAAGHPACFVLGDPAYYGRFGFRPAAPLGFTCRWPTEGGAFQVLELQPNALAGKRGRVAYLPAFDVR